MPTFSDITEIPAQEYYDAPDYLSGGAAKWASLLGFKKTGQRNAWGKLFSTFNPLAGMASNKVAEKIAKDQGATDTQENVQDVFQGDLLKAKVGLQAAALVGGTLAGSPQLGTAAGGMIDKAITTTPNDVNASTSADGKTSAAEAAAGGVQTATATGMNNTEAPKIDPVTGKAEMSTPSMDYTSTIANGIPIISSVIDGIVNRRRYGANMANDAGSVFRYRYKKGGKVKCEDGGKIEVYAEENDAEDVDMIDKKTGEKVGEMRYNERIFSQEDTITMENLADKGMYHALGMYTALSIKEQDHEADPNDEQEDKAEEKMSEADKEKEDMKEEGMGSMVMMYGGRVRRKSKFAAGGLFLDPYPKPKTGIKSVMQGYSPSQALFDPTGYGAFINDANKLTADQRRAAFTAYLPKVKTEKERQLLMSAMSDTDSNLNLASDFTYGPVHDAIFSFLSSGGGTPQTTGTPTGTPNATGATNPLTGLPYTVIGEGDNMPSSYETTSDIFSNMDYGSNTATTRNRKRMATSDIIGYGSDALGAIAGLTGANQDMPEWKLPNDWRINYNELRQMRNQGLTPEEKSIATDLTNETYAADVANIRNVTAAGGNAGQVLANTRGAATSRYRNNQQTVLADVSQRRQNRALFNDVLRQDISYDRQIFEDEYTEAANSVNTYAQLAEQSLQNMSDRTDFIDMYGEGSAYDQLMQMQIANAGLQNERLSSSLRVKGVNPVQAEAISKPVLTTQEGSKVDITNESADYSNQPPNATDNTFTSQPSVNLTQVEPVESPSPTDNSAIPTIQLSEGNTLDLSTQPTFNKAFADAKKQLKEGEVFIYKGKKYTVKTK